MPVVNNKLLYNNIIVTAYNTNTSVHNNIPSIRGHPRTGGNNNNYYIITVLRASDFHSHDFHFLHYIVVAVMRLARSTVA